ncbi:MAG: NifU family protein [Ignavibacteria bacterium]|nr:NifU family protein [Ignavibacteria bacterium]MBT8382074.1 NifU family protein [Ignavibacteria bacterium]MBT8390232.1 NifU family protein [Ignavibacteria bacterium]NNJ52815.1 NifU family protein [Ignavibacteriaceae bacterium]NNL20885.1 NifU family protein [Ignavibacteriaceae bacterium]
MLMVENVDLTPNPHALKFILNEKLLNIETRQYAEKDSAENDPFANGIFKIDGVVSVFYMDRFVTIEKSPDANWGQIQRPFIEFLKSFDKNLIPEETTKPPTEEEENELLQKINELLDQKVRPALAGDGGGLEVLGVDGFRVSIRYQGACGSCPSAISGTLMAIEGLLRKDINPSIEVVAA